MAAGQRLGIKAVRLQSIEDRASGLGVESSQGLDDRSVGTARQAVGYKELLPVVADTATIEEGRRQAIAATLAVAGKQRTYLRRDPRIRWIEWDDDPAVRRDRVREEFAAWSS